MSDILLGTIIGGVIASIVPVITICVEYKKWKKAQTIDNLRKKREQLEKTYQETIQALKDGIINNYFTIEMIADFEIMFPQKVTKAFQEYMKEDKKNKYQKALLYQDIIKEMKRSLSKLDKKIEALLS